MTLITATTLTDQVDFLSTNGQSFADKTLNSIFNISPRNAVIDEDDDDDLDATTLPDPDEDDLIDDDDDAFPDDLDTVDDDDVIDDEDDLDDDDDTGSTTAGMRNPPGGSGAQGRTSGRMTDHEPGSINNNDL